MHKMLPRRIRLFFTTRFGRACFARPPATHHAQPGMVNHSTAETAIGITCAVLVVVILVLLYLIKVKRTRLQQKRQAEAGSVKKRGKPYHQSTSMALNTTLRHACGPGAVCGSGGQSRVFA